MSAGRKLTKDADHVSIQNFTPRSSISATQVIACSSYVALRVPYACTYTQNSSTTTLSLAAGTIIWVDNASLSTITLSAAQNIETM